MITIRRGTAVWAVGAVAAAAMLGLAWACGGGAVPEPAREGAATPEQAVERFLGAATEAQKARRSGQMTVAQQHYDEMAYVFGTDGGSILRAESRTRVRDRMIALAGLLDPRAYRVQPGIDPRVRETGRTTITVELNHQGTLKVVPFTVVRGRGDRWYVEQIDMRPITG